MDNREFTTSAEVREFVKELKVARTFTVRYRDNPFGGRGLFWVKLKDIPAGTTMIHSSGSNVATETFTSDADVSARITKLRNALKGTNARADH